MSRQNPNVLDQMCAPAPRPAGQDLRGNEGGGWHHKGAVSVGETAQTSKANHMSWKLNNYTPSPRQSSYLHHVLKHRSQSNSPSSLVQLATRNSPGRLLKYGIGRSPVTVRLAGVKKEENKPMEVRSISEDQQTDPCNKEVVLSALRQRRQVQEGCLVIHFRRDSSHRKRWASAAPEEIGSTPSTSPTVISPPMSKRSRFVVATM